jgi:hypothetical protein
MVACSDDDSDSPPNQTDTPAADSKVTPVTPRVEIDLSPWNAQAKGAFVRRISDEADLMSGAAAQGKIGDWIIGNDKAHFIIQGHDRHSGPCPWGGNVIDVALLSDTGEAFDVAGELCSFIQLGRTLLPEHFEVVADGSEGPAILAVTGKDTVLDFLNINSLISSFLGANVELPVDANLDLPIAMTAYYILDGDTNALRTIMAFRNDGQAEQPVHIFVGDILDSGGSVEFFNPFSSMKGFGYAGYNPEPMDFLAFRGTNASFAYVPDRQADGSHGASYLAISGVAGIGLGIDNILTALTQPLEKLLEDPALLSLSPGQSDQVARWIIAGNGSLSSITDTIYALRDEATGTVDFSMWESVSGEAVTGHRVSFVSNGRALTQCVTDAKGACSLTLPAGEYDIVPDTTSRRVVEGSKIVVKVGEKIEAQVLMEPQARIQVSVTDLIGKPTPAKVAVRCVGECPGPGNSQMRDVTTDRLPGGLQAIAFVDTSGTAELLLPSGEYALVVSRGPAWSVWPDDDLSGFPVNLEPGQTLELDATISKVLPLDGWISGDLHVHAVNSPDSPISNERRVRSMMAEGVDVLVSTDHDYITDFAPTIKALGAESQIVSVIGEELTTFDYGHFNAFPLDHQPDDLNGGAFDWGNAEKDNHHPAKIFAALHAHSGEQVIQVNHAAGGYFGLTGLDPETGTTMADPAGFRIDMEGYEFTGDDTGLFDDGWTAMEMLNGLKGNRFYDLAAYWFTFLSRGMQKTGTAVSDTHKSLSSQSGGSRSWVWVGTDQDTPESFDAYHWAKQVNAGHLVGSNGPMVEFSATVANSGVHITGDTLKMDAPGTVAFTARILVPRWMRVNRVELVGNVTGVAPVDGLLVPVNIKPLESQEFELGPKDLVDDQYYERIIDLSHDVDADGWYLVLVHGDGENIPSMTPVTPKDVAPFAFTNPIYVDIGGNGWKPEPTPPENESDAGEASFEADSPLPARQMNADDARKLLRLLRFKHSCD